MASLFGRLQAPRLHPRPLLPRRSSLRHLPIYMLAGALLALALPAAATEPIPGHSVESIRAWVLEHNPELRAMGLETQAAEARILPAGALPDPMASVGFRGLDPDRPWRTVGAEREVNYALRQRFPLWGKRDLARNAASQDAVAIGLDRITAARDLLSDAFVLVLTGFLLQWPTLLTLASYPVLVWAYARLARREEKDCLSRFGNDYVSYMQEIPAFIPRRRRAPAPSAGGTR